MHYPVLANAVGSTITDTDQYVAYFTIRDLFSTVHFVNRFNFVEGFI